MRKDKGPSKTDVLQALDREEWESARASALVNAAWWQLNYGPNNAMYFWAGKGLPPDGLWNFETLDPPPDHYVSASWEWLCTELFSIFDSLPMVVYVEDDSGFIGISEPEAWQDEDGVWYDPEPHTEYKTARIICGDTLYRELGL